MSDIYKQKGYENRKAYLAEQADNFSIDLGTVEALADLLGENEDFDGLVTALEDM